MLKRLLNRTEEDLLHVERTLLQQLHTALVQLDAVKEDQSRLQQAQQQLNELFLLVVVGEFNAGKSAFINALLGQSLLEEGATPTTMRVHIIRHGEQVTRHLLEAEMEQITAPLEWLREINIVDTPGANAVVLRHQQITEEFVPRSDLVLFVTSADRPFSESERLFMQRIREWGKKVVIVINKADILDEADTTKVRAFVVENAVKLLGVEPQIFMVSAKLAQRAKAANQQPPVAGQPGVLELWSESRFEPLERYILDTLDEKERLRLKLFNPLGIAGKLREHYSAITANRLEVLGDDFTTIDTVEKDLDTFEEDTRRDFQYRLSQIDAILYEMSDRGVAFIDQWLRLGRVFDLTNSAKVREAFERDVVADTTILLERQVSDLIDWIVEREHRQWQGIMAYLNRRADLHKDRVIGEVGGSFENNRRALLEAVRRDTQRALSGFDQQAEATKLAESVQNALAHTALVEAGALGLGAILLTALHTLVLDLTGLLFAGAVAAVGLYVLPNRRRKAREDLRAKVSELQGNLHETLSAQFEKELARSRQAMQEAIQPYTRFIRNEREKLTAINSELATLEQAMRTLHAKIEAL
ncbi:MAG: dynamin family protein [Caldilineales bacterium]